MPRESEEDWIPWRFYVASIPLFVVAQHHRPSTGYHFPEFLIVSGLGLLNTLSGVIVPSLVSAFGIFMCRQFCESIPGDLMAASVLVMRRGSLPRPPIRPRTS
jgi:ABC-type glycerol-3-phosphate transport system permease component